MATNKLTMLDLPWQDIVFTNIVPLLNIRDVFNLRCVSREYKLLVESYWEAMTNLCLSQESRFNQKAFKILAKHCRSVRYFNVADCKWLSDNICTTFFRYNTNLVDVNLSNTVNIGPKSLQCLIINCKQLKVLKLSECQWLTPGAVDSITVHQKNLEVVDFSKCMLLSEACILKFVTKCPNLRYLSVALIPALSDNVIISLALHCPGLEDLTIHGCAISFEAIRFMVERCKNLRTLKATGKFIRPTSANHY